LANQLLGLSGGLLMLAAGSTASADFLALQRRPGPIARGSDQEARSLLGKPAPPLPALRWLDGKPRTLASLAGRVVVLRSFTHDCPFCVSTLPALQRLSQDYREKGVVVLGVYHPKPPRPVTDREAAEHARALGVSFPIGIDPEWALVKRWWLDGGRHWTSVTWVVDRQGVVRHIHPGGEYHAGGGAAHARCRDDERALRAAIEAALLPR
jgi:thiol-disulfide isomerase/thioredoxin